MLLCFQFDARCKYSSNTFSHRSDKVYQLVSEVILNLSY